MKDNWKHKNQTMICKTCMWYLPKRDSNLGRCRKHAPTLDGWPVVLETDWCGDHKLDESRTNISGIINNQDELTKLAKDINDPVNHEVFFGETYRHVIFTVNDKKLHFIVDAELVSFIFDNYKEIINAIRILEPGTYAEAGTAGKPAYRITLFHEPKEGFHGKIETIQFASI